jgi:uncharacterized protein
MEDFALFDAAFGNDCQRIADAVGRGADPNEVHPQSGSTPLSVACESGSEEAVNALLHAGADPCKTFSWRSRVSGAECSNRTALMSASTPAIVRLLVAKGADVNSVDQYGWSALVHAVDMVYIDVFVALREAGASLNVAVRRGQEMLSLAGFIEEKITHLKELGHPRPNAKLSGMLHDLGRMLEMVQVAR